MDSPFIGTFKAQFGIFGREFGHNFIIIYCIYRSSDA